MIIERFHNGVLVETVTVADIPADDDQVVVTRGELSQILTALRDQVITELAPASVDTVAEAKAGVIDAVTDVAAIIEGGA